MSSIIEGYNYDIFISYRQKDNKYDGWVTEFVDNLKKELEATFKEEISVYFDINPHDGLLETHDVDESLKEKLKCLVFIPVISRTYCDPKSFAWEHEFKAFVEMSSKDQFGLKIKLPKGNVASRVLPVRIHDLDSSDTKLCESILGGVLRGIEFIYKEPGVNRPLRSEEDNPSNNLNKTFYRNQINKVAIAIKEIILGLKNGPVESTPERKEALLIDDKPPIKEKSIIVLPFENISPDPDQEYFSDGLTEEIITDLSHIHDLLVISRSSAMTFKGTKKTIPEIAQSVNVRYVLEGSVRKAGNNLRITAQLIDANSDMHLWAEKYTGILDSVFDIQEKVSHAIIGALKLKLTDAEERQIEKRPLPSIQVYDIYLQARKAIQRFTEEGFSEAVNLLKAGLNIIGDNALLFAGLGYAHFMSIDIGAKPEDVVSKAEDYANRALSLDPNLSQAHMLLGYIQQAFHGNQQESIRHLKEALSINPSDLDAILFLCLGFCFVGKTLEASRMAHRHIELDPLNPNGQFLLAYIQFLDGRFALAVELANTLIEHLNSTMYRFWMAYFLAYINKYTEALKFVDKIEGTTILDQFFGLLKFSLKGKSKELTKSLSPEIVAMARRDPMKAGWFVSFYSILDDREHTLMWIETAINLGFINYPFFNEFDPFLAKFRGEEHFRKLMERMKYEWENFEV